VNRSPFGKRSRFLRVGGDLDAAASVRAQAPYQIACRSFENEPKRSGTMTTAQEDGADRGSAHERRGPDPLLRRDPVSAVMVKETLGAGATMGHAVAGSATPHCVLDTSSSASCSVSISTPALQLYDSLLLTTIDECEECRP
jgi:hypothetical protein